MEEAKGPTSLMEETVSTLSPRILEYEVSVSQHFWSLGPPGFVGEDKYKVTLETLRMVPAPRSDLK